MTDKLRRLIASRGAGSNHPRGGHLGWHDHARRRRSLQGEAGNYDRRRTAAGGDGSAKCEHCARLVGAAVGVDFVACPECGKGLGGVRPLRPGAAARLGLLSLLHQDTAGEARAPRTGGSGLACHQAEKTIYQLLKVDPAAEPDEIKARVSGTDCPVPSGQGSSPREGISGSGGGASRRADRRLPDADEQRASSLRPTLVAERPGGHDTVCRHRRTPPSRLHAARRLSALPPNAPEATTSSSARSSVACAASSAISTVWWITRGVRGFDAAWCRHESSR